MVYREVSMKNCICKNCGAKFHYCGSCGYERACEAGFCSDECLVNSTQYKQHIQLIDDFLSKLTKEQHLQLQQILDNYNTYEFVLDSKLTDKLKEQQNGNV